MSGESDLALAWASFASALTQDDVDERAPFDREEQHHAFALACAVEQAEEAWGAHASILKGAVDADGDHGHALVFQDGPMAHGGQAHDELAKPRVLACDGAMDEDHACAHRGGDPEVRCSPKSLHCQVAQCCWPLRSGTSTCTFLVSSATSLFASPHEPSS